MATVIKNIPFVGGNTQTFEFDFGTKVAGSVVECPMKIYASSAVSILTPSSPVSDNMSDISAKWWTGFDKDQANSIDKLKQQDGACPAMGASSGGIAQYMIELDLTSLCNSLFGGSTSAMQTALQNVISVFYAKGSGVHNGVIDYTVASATWSNTNSVWNPLSTNKVNAINPITYTESTSGSNRINSTNKMYFLLSVYASDGTTASELDLDYVNIKLQFARVPDVISLLPITLPNTWSILIKGFSPAWNTSDLPSGYTKYVLKLTNSSDNASYDLSYQNGKFVLGTWNGSTPENLWGDSLSITKFKTINILIEQTNSGIRMRISPNSNTTLKYTLASSRNFAGNKVLSLLMHSTGQYQADAFINSIVFLPNRTFDDDTEAESALRGTEIGFETDELFDITKVTLHDASIQNNTIVLNAKNQFDGSYINIPVLPNNQYELKVTMNSTGNPYTEITAYYNNILLKTISDLMSSKTYDYLFTTPDKCNYIRLFFANASNDNYTYTFSNISLKLKM